MAANEEEFFKQFNNKRPDVPVDANVNEAKQDKGRSYIRPAISRHLRQSDSVAYVSMFLRLPTESDASLRPLLLTGVKEQGLRSETH